MSLNESIVEDAALNSFGKIGYAVGRGPQLAHHTATRDGAFIQSEAKLQVMLRSREANEAKDNLAVQLCRTANGPVFVGSSNHPGVGDIHRHVEN